MVAAGDYAARLQRRQRLLFLWRRLRQSGVDGHVHQLAALIISPEGERARDIYYDAGMSGIFTTSLMAKS